MLPYELLIGLRYTRAKRRNHFISFISLISMLGIGLGVMALIVVLSVMNGFQKEIRARILGITPHLQVIGSEGIANWQSTLDSVAAHPGVRAAAPYVTGQGMLSQGERVQGVMVRGILPDAEQELIALDDKMKHGTLNTLQSGEFNIVLGVDLARSLGARVGDPLLLITPQGQFTPAGMLPRLKQFKVSGIFEIGMSPYDNALALIHLGDAQKLYRTGNSVSGISGSVLQLDEAPQIARALEGQLPSDRWVTDWTRQNASYFAVVAMEKRMMFIILSLIVLVAAFNIVSTLVMAVTDKQADIAILRTLGASPASIMRIFMLQGMLIGLVGMVAGVLGGVLIAANIDTLVPFIEDLFGVQFLAKEFYYISELPSDLQVGDVAVVAGMSFLISLAATLYPSWRAAKVQPAEALRYE